MKMMYSGGKFNATHLHISQTISQFFKFDNTFESPFIMKELAQDLRKADHEINVEFKKMDFDFGLLLNQIVIFNLSNQCEIFQQRVEKLVIFEFVSQVL
jgi:hypothetical protein